MLILFFLSLNRVAPNKQESDQRTRNETMKNIEDTYAYLKSDLAELMVLTLESPESEYNDNGFISSEPNKMYNLDGNSGLTFDYNIKSINVNPVKELYNNSYAKTVKKYHLISNLHIQFHLLTILRKRIELFDKSKLLKFYNILIAAYKIQFHLSKTTIHNIDSKNTLQYYERLLINIDNLFDFPTYDKEIHNDKIDADLKYVFIFQKTVYIFMCTYYKENYDIYRNLYIIVNCLVKLQPAYLELLQIQRSCIDFIHLVYFLRFRQITTCHHSSENEIFNLTRYASPIIDRLNIVGCMKDLCKYFTNDTTSDKKAAMMLNYIIENKNDNFRFTRIKIATLGQTLEVFFRKKNKQEFVGIIDNLMNFPKPNILYALKVIVFTVSVKSTDLKKEKMEIDLFSMYHKDMFD